jgi:hypothetical protein
MNISPASRSHYPEPLARVGSVLGDGLEYLVAEDVQLDCSGNFGVTSAADDVNVFTGIAVGSEDPHYYANHLA